MQVGLGCASKASITPTHLDSDYLWSSVISTAGKWKLGVGGSSIYSVIRIYIELAVSSKCSLGKSLRKGNRLTSCGFGRFSILTESVSLIRKSVSKSASSLAALEDLEYRLERLTSRWRDSFSGKHHFLCGATYSITDAVFFILRFRVVLRSVTSLPGRHRRVRSQKGAI